MISLRQERTPMRCTRSHRGSFFWHHMGIFTFAYPYLSTIHSLRQRRFPPALKTKWSPRACGSMKWMKKPARIRAKPNVKQKKSQELAVLDKPKLTCALNKKNPPKDLAHLLGVRSFMPMASLPLPIRILARFPGFVNALRCHSNPMHHHPERWKTKYQSPVTSIAFSK